MRLGHVGLQVKSFYGDNELTIKSIDECNWNDFDIMVIGHVDEQEQQLNINIKQELLEQCLIHKKMYTALIIILWINIIGIFKKMGCLYIIPLF